ncbi:motility protein B [Oxobacter pfennigii]|uniref:Motility protein B n=1 Tax=Oxobacter pfennigii TaxID=36849 RepID=A0A0P8WQ53_9CLOT|nr:OmpA family protein [Oxobacter pfennigii]KPU44698.1 motility protein B [Oxobacter pfennigii]
MTRKKAEKKEISQEWLTTYSDMMTLLLTFFVLLYSFSIIDTIKFRKLSSSLASALNNSGADMFEVYETSGDVPVIGEEVPGSDVLPNQNGNAMYNAVTEFVNDNNLGEYVTIKESARGIIIEFKDRILFDTGRAEIKNEGVPVLMKITELIGNMPNDIIIEGHTDNVPISTAQFPSNWELSSARALRVMWYLTENRGLDPKRFSVQAFGEYNPIAGNDTPEGRAQNRRVNILILSKNDEELNQVNMP